MPNRMAPVSSATTLWTARRASSEAASVASACGRRDSAAAVATTPRPTRRKSVVPSDFSSARICSETEGWA